MTAGRDVIDEAIGLLKQRYGMRYGDFLDAYEGTPTIPATIFSTRLTPLETAAQYLVTHKNCSLKQAASYLHRTTSILRNALNNADKKKISVADDPHTPYRIPVSAFKNTLLSPAETIILYLADHYSLNNASIAKMLGRDGRNTWKLLKQARKRSGGKA